MIYSVQRDGTGTGAEAKVYSNGAIPVAIMPAPVAQLTMEETQQVKLFTAKLRDSSLSTDMNADGSSDVVNFDCPAETEKIITLNQIRMVFNDEQMDITTMEARRFGSAAASPGLTNGIQLQTIQSGVVTDIFLDPVVKIGDFYNYAAGGLNTAIINDINAVANNVDLLTIIIDFIAPVSLFADTQDVVRIVVRDDLTDVNFFETYCYGTQQILP